MAQNKQKLLLQWVKRKVAPYKISVEDFHLSWKSGLAFCALIESIQPGLIQFNTLNPSEAENNCKLAFEIAEKNLGIPALLDPADVIIEKPDHFSIMTYIISIYKKYGDTPQTRTLSSPTLLSSEQKQGNSGAADSTSSEKKESEGSSDSNIDSANSTEKIPTKKEPNKDVN